jgi:IclR family pca regulon transcriptional regulator
LAILRTFSPDRPWLGIAELADELEMSRPTTHRYASTLVALGYLEQGPRRKYRLGMRAGNPGRSAVNSTALGMLPGDYLAELRDRSMCTASLAVMHGGDILYVDRARSSWQGHTEVTARLGRGSRLRAASTALGRVLLAHRSPEQQYEALSAEPSRQSSDGVEMDAEKLVRELDGIREKGFAITDQVHVEGQVCVAAPVHSRSADVIGAVDVAAPKDRSSRSGAVEQLVPLVLECAAGMSAHLGYAPSS